MRICTECEKEKSIDQFYRNTYNSDGLDDLCRDCRDRIDNLWTAFYQSLRKRGNNETTS